MADSVAVVRVPQVGNVVTVGLQGPPGPSNDGRIGTTLGLSSMADGNVMLDFDTPWGVDGAGVPYWDNAGAAPGEEYILLVEPGGALVLTRPGG
jgi:hypothetical protein